MVLGSNLTNTAAQLLGSCRLRLYQDCIFLKEPGFTQTNWWGLSIHQQCKQQPIFCPTLAASKCSQWQMYMLSGDQYAGTATAHCHPWTRAPLSLHGSLCGPSRCAPHVLPSDGIHVLCCSHAMNMSPVIGTGTFICLQTYAYTTCF